MATRSTISYQIGKKGKTIYCHWDGYIANNGAKLLKHYNTIGKVKNLIALGNLSILGNTVGSKIKFDGFDSNKNPQCLAYGRDRDETEQEATIFTDKPDKNRFEDYNYLFKRGKWYVAKGDSETFVLLNDLLLSII